MTDELTKKQEHFVVEYLRDHNGKQAAIRAGYSPKTAEVTASRLVRNVKVRAELEARQAKVAERAEITAEWVLRGLQKNALEHEGSASTQAYGVIAKCIGMFDRPPPPVQSIEQNQTPQQLSAHQSHQASLFLRELKAEEGIETIDEAVEWLERQAEAV